MRSLFVLIAAGMLASCAAPVTTPDQLPPDAVRITGTITHAAIEGGFWAIRGDDGVVYDPIRPLAAEFLMDGLRVSVVLRIRNDMAGTHMVGPLVEVLGITRMAR
jgi:hypothetical protein